MKVNLRKYQSGGPFVTLNPVFDTPQATTTQSSSQQESKSLVDDESNDMLKKGGLTSDYYVLLDSLTKLESDPMSFMDSNNSGKAVRMMRGKINEMINNKEIWKSSVEDSRKKGSYNEVAVGTNGEIFYKDEDNSIKATSVDEYQKMKSHPSLLTIGDLLNERQGNIKLAFNDNIFTVADNSVGMKEITDHVLSLFDTLSQVSTKTERHYTKEDIGKQYGLQADLIKQGGKKITAEERKALSSIVTKLQTPGEFIKEELKTSGKGKDTQVALNYIWKTLGDNAQKKLTTVAKLQGDNPLVLLAGMLDNYSATSTESIISPEKESQVRDVDKSGSSGGMRSISPFEVGHLGKTGKEVVVMNDPSTGKRMNIVATSQFRLTDMDGTPLGVKSIDDIFKTKIGTLLKVDKATFGENLIDLSNSKDILYDGEEAVRAYLPVRSDGTADLDKMESIKNLEAEILARPELTPEQINEAFADMGLTYIQVNAKKQYIVNDRFKPFLILHGYAGEKSNAASNNGKIKALDSSEKSRVMNYLEPIWDSSGVDPTGWAFNRTLYKGMIAVPYSDDSSIYATSIGNNLMIPQASLQDARINKQSWQGSNINADPSSIFNN